jgi:serine/threonine protein kinase/tetratricopeptide (TPR) repeat protein
VEYKIMTDPRWSERSIFEAAIDKGSPGERAAYLDQVCGSNPGLRQQVEALLAAHERLGNISVVTTVDEVTTERVGTVIGPYKLLEQIGEGGFGVVFMAEQTKPVRRKVALKILKAGMDTKQVIARFEAERQALAMMDHSNIARVFDGGATDSGRPYFVMELVRGQSLTEYCDQNNSPIHERLDLFISVCQAVQHAHQKGIIHRDIKPSNILVTLHDGVPVPKVIDFGIAKATGPQLTEKTLFTNFAQMIGTPLYMSPEQAEVSGLDIDTRSDIYSLGVVLYELLTGTTPFDKERLRSAGYDEIRRIIREEEPCKPSTRMSALDETATTASTKRGSDPKRLSRHFRGELDWIVMKALEKQRNRRYETASAFAADVLHYLNDEPVHACPPSAWYKFRKLVRRKKTALAMVACVFLALAAIAGSMGWAVRDRVARDHDQAAREEALDNEVERLLDEAGPLIEQGKWPEALDVVERADKLLTSAGRFERPQRLLELREDLLMAQRLEDVYREPKPDLKAHMLTAAREGTEHTSHAQQDSAEEEFFWGRHQDARFYKAFQEFGIDLEALSPAEAAARIGRTCVPQALVRALDEWSPMRKRARGDDDAFWKKLLEVARQADPDPWRNQFRESLLQRNRPALEKLADSLPIREVSPATAYLMGHALNDLGALDNAMAMLREAHRHHPDDFWLNDALGYFSKDFCRPPRYDDALRYYSMAVALRPRSARTHFAVAEVLEEKGSTDEAIAEYSTTIELEPKNVIAWNNRGHAYIELHQYDKALADFSKAIELNPNVADAWNGRGVVYCEFQQYDKALADHSKAIELDPMWAVAWYNRSVSYYELHQYDKALADLNKAIELDPKDVVFWFDRAKAYNELHQYDNAIADFSKAIELEPKNASAWNERAKAYNELHRYDKALADLNKAIELDPKDAMSWFYRARAYNGLHHYDKAVADFAKALELKPNDPVFQNDLAWYLATCPEAKLRDPKRAVELAAAAVKARPEEATFWNTLGMARYRAGDWKGAAEALQDALKLFQGATGFQRGVGRSLFYLAMAQHQLGHRQEARQTYDRALAWLETNRTSLRKIPWLNDELGHVSAEVAELLEIQMPANPEPELVRPSKASDGP